VLDSVHKGEDGHWPPTYDAELERATSKGHNPQNSGRIIPERCVSTFAFAFLESIHGEDFGDEAYFICTMQGVRAETAHNPSLDDHEEAYHTFRSKLNGSLMDKTNWWIDVGHEIQLPRHVLWWKKEAHLSIIQEVLQLDEESAQQLLRSGSYAADQACHLTEAAGFRLIVPEKFQHYSGVCYIQLYCSEKTAVYRAGGGTSQVDTRRLLEDITPEIVSFSNKMENIFKACLDENTSGHARLEVRVKLSEFKINEPFISLDYQFAQNSIYKFSSREWW
jgi:hypothetical protein